MINLVYNFELKKNKNIKNPKYILGGKGANLAEMGRLGFPVPPGFTISTEACDLFYNNKKKIPNKLISQIKNEIKVLENKTKKKIWRFKKPAFNFCKIRSKSFNARNDGYNSQFRIK